jgi:hypothetical protein
MAGTDLVPVDQQSTFDLLPQANELATAIARTDFVPGKLRGNPAAVMACVLSGHELGIGPMQSLQKIHVIDGRPALASELMRALVLQAGHDIWVEESSSTKVTVAGQRKGSDHVTRVTWTLDDAKRANLTGKQNWRNYPRAMLLARATAELCRMVFPDVIGGLYAKEEVEDGFLFDEAVEAEVVEEKPTQRRKASPAPAKAAAKKATAAAKKAAPAPAAARPQPPLPGEDPVEDGEEGLAESLGDPASAVEAGAVTEQELEVDEVLKKRRQQIAMRCNEQGIDRAQLIAACTAGRTTSAKELQADEAADVLEALRQIKQGELALDTSGEHPQLVDPPEGDDAIVDAEIVEDGDETAGGQAATGWDAAAWRSYLKQHGRSIVTTIQWAQAKAKDAGYDPPRNVVGIGQNPELTAAVCAWVESEEDR